MKLGLSDGAVCRIARHCGGSSDTLAVVSLLESPEGWYVHAADRPLLQRNTGYVTLCVPAEDYIKVEHYGEYYNFVDLSNGVAVSEIQDRVIDRLQQDYQNDALYPDLESSLAFALENGESWDQIGAGLDPQDIVDSAEWWDSPEFASWFSEAFSDIVAVLTWDGAVIMDLGRVLVVHSIQRDELDEAMGY